MADSRLLNELTPRDAVADTLHRAILGLDGNDHALFKSACLANEDMVFVGGGFSVTGWDAINALFSRAFELITMHVISNVRVAFQDANTAWLTAHAVSYHVRPEDKDSVEERSYTGYSLYDVEVVRDGDGGWKIKKWEIRLLRTTGDKAIIHA